MIFGGPPEFKTRADGIPGLKKNYGVEFGKYTVTDVGGPVTVNALKRGQVDAADLFTTDPAIAANDFVILEDPKSNFAAQNVVPIINKAKAHRRRQAGPQRDPGQADHRGPRRAARQGRSTTRRTRPTSPRAGSPTTASTPPARRQGRVADGRLGELPRERDPGRDLRPGARGPGRDDREEAEHRQPRRSTVPALKDGLDRPVPRVHRLDPGLHRQERHGDQPRRRLRRAGQGAAAAT